MKKAFVFEMGLLIRDIINLEENLKALREKYPEEGISECEDNYPWEAEGKLSAARCMMEASIDKDVIGK